MLSWPTGRHRQGQGLTATMKRSYETPHRETRSTVGYPSETTWSTTRSGPFDQPVLGNRWAAKSLVQHSVRQMEIWALEAYGASTSCRNADRQSRDTAYRTTVYQNHQSFFFFFFFFFWRSC